VIVKGQGIDDSYVSRMVNLTMLAPDIVAAILEETLPPEVTLFELGAVTAYNVNDGTMPETPQLMHSINGFNDVEKNEDGSINIWFGAEKPANASESNWIQTVDGRDFIAVIRLTAPELNFFVPYLFLRFINFTAIATTPPAARRGRTPGSGASIIGGGPHVKPGSSNRRVVSNFSAFMIPPPVIHREIIRQNPDRQ
jgi:hypothetical protein